MKDTK